jgi:hypothetical protein
MRQKGLRVNPAVGQSPRERRPLRREIFVGRWVHRWLYYQAPGWVFTVAYVGWALATLLTLRLVTPRISREAPS